MDNSKIVAINKKNLQANADSADEYDFEDTMKKFDKYSCDPKQKHKIFTELGFSWHDDEDFCFACDRNGSCPEHPGEKGVYLNGRLDLDTTPFLKKIRIVVDLLEIADAMENHSYADESTCYLDIETGEVAYVTSEVARIVESGNSTAADDLPDWQKDEVELAQQMLNDGERFIPIPRLESSVGFRVMEDFIDQLGDESVAKRLVQSLRWSRPFRGFKDVLSDHPDLLDRWYAFKNEKMRKEVGDFLKPISHDRIELIMPSRP